MFFGDYKRGKRKREREKRPTGALCPNECRHGPGPTQTALPAVGHLVLICSTPLSVSPSPLFCFRFIPPFFILGKGVKVLWWFCHFRGIGRRHRIAFVTARSWHRVWATAIGTLIETLYVFIASSTSLSQRPSH